MERRKVVVISGCDRGFGFLLAKALVEGTDYWILALALMVRSSRLVPLQCDITSQEDVSDGASDLFRTGCSLVLDIVNNAGMASGRRFFILSRRVKFTKPSREWTAKHARLAF